jgi:RNA polymerase sigma-70 factor (ECF subfamily)
MLAVARRRCASAEDAEDCVHEAMLRVAQFAGLDPARVEALLTSVVTRLAVDMHRARARAQRYQPRLLHVPEQQEPPDEAALDAAEARWLAAQMEQLPARERDVLRRRVAGHSVSETAALLSLSYKSVESAFTRARGRMRMWAAAGSLLLADLLRRLREHPAATWASLAAVSAGCLILSTQQVPAQHGGAASTAAGSAASWHATGAELPPQPVAAAALTTSLQPPPGKSPSNATRAQRPSPAISSHTIVQGSVPAGPGSVGFGFTSYQEQGTFLDFTTACAERTLADPHVDPSALGCPPQ